MSLTSKANRKPEVIEVEISKEAVGKKKAIAEERTGILESESAVSCKKGISHGNCMKQMFTLQSTAKGIVVFIPTFSPLTGLHTEII